MLERKQRQRNIISRGYARQQRAECGLHIPSEVVSIIFMFYPNTAFYIAHENRINVKGELINKEQKFEFEYSEDEESKPNRFYVKNVSTGNRQEIKREESRNTI